MSSGQPASPWLSIITVVKDDADGFARTVTSIESQDTDGVEHVVVDSSRPPLDLPDSVGSRAWVEPAGIYSAMNAALSLASGDFVLFLNAGDMLHDPAVLARVRALLSARQPTWAFGEVEIVERGGTRTVTPRWDYARERAGGFSGGHFPPHQGTFASRETLITVGGFDTSYAITADYAAFLRLSQVADPLYLDLIVATFVEGGVSTTRWRDSLAEFHRARRANLSLHGAASLREYTNTGRQFLRMAAYRGVWAKVAKR